MATYSLKLSIENCVQIAADRDMVVLLLTAYRKSPSLYPMVPSPTPTTYRLATVPHNCHTILRYDPLRSFKVIDFNVIWKPICDFLLAIHSNLGPILHHLAAIHLCQTDERTTTVAIVRLLFKYGRLRTYLGTNISTGQEHEQRISKYLVQRVRGQGRQFQKPR